MNAWINNEFNKIEFYRDSDKLVVIPYKHLESGGERHAGAR